MFTGFCTQYSLNEFGDKRHICGSFMSCMILRDRYPDYSSTADEKHSKLKQK